MYIVTIIPKLIIINNYSIIMLLFMEEWGGGDYVMEKTLVYILYICTFQYARLSHIHMASASKCNVQYKYRVLIVEPAS